MSIPEGSGPVVEVSGLSVRFGPTTVFEGVDLALSHGVVGVLGPNGSGKTTLIRSLGSVLPIQTGSISVLGRDLANRSDVVEARRAIGYLPQVFGYHGGFTASEFVEYLAWLKFVPASERRSAVASALADVGMTDRSGSKMKKLSGGMRRRVGIAQAIVNQPELLLLDEPTAGLDPEQRVLFRRLLRRLGETSAVVVSTHLVEDVAAACDRVIVFAHGGVRFDGSADDLAELGKSSGVDGDTATERGYLTVVGGAI